MNEKCFAEKTQGQIAKCLSTNVVAQFGSVPKFIQDASGNTIAVTLGETAANLIPAQYAAFVKLAIELYFLAKSFRVDYEFLPSLAIRIGESNDVELRLNKDAVFGGRKSVVMFIPPTRGANSNPAPIFSINQITSSTCAGISKSNLPIEKPQALIQSEYANSFALSFSNDSGRKQDNVPLTVNREIGAFEFDSNQIDRSLLNDSNLVTGTINGQWGLSPLQPIQFKVTKQQTTSWEISTDDQKNFEKGKKFTVTLKSPAAGCVQKIVLRDRDDNPYEAELKYQYTNPISVLATFDLSKDEVVAGEGKIQISSIVENETATTEIGTLVLRPLSNELPQIELHTADNMLRVSGADADLVSTVKIGGLTFVRREPTDANFREGWTNDGQFLFEQNNQKVPNGLVRERATIIYDRERNRKMDVVINKVVRPSVTVSSPEITVSRTSPFRDIDVKQVVPAIAKLKFSLNTQNPYVFPNDPALSFQLRIVEPNVSNIAPVSLNQPNQRAQIVRESQNRFNVTLVPSELGLTTATGALEVRVVNPDGTVGDWVRVANPIVRLPNLQKVSIKRVGETVQHLLRGTDLTWIESFSATRDGEFKIPVGCDSDEPNCLNVTRLIDNGNLFLKIKDFPSLVIPVTLTMEFEP